MSLRLTAVYAVFVVLGLIVMTTRISTQATATYVDASAWLATPTVYYLASRPLPANHRLTELDLKPPEDLPSSLSVGLISAEALVGRYVERPLATGAVIYPQTLRSRPTVAVAEGKAIVRVPVDDAPSRRLDVDRCVTLCDDGGCLETPARVLALDCWASSDEDCELLLEEDDSTMVSAAYRDGKRKLVIVPCPKKGG